MPDQESRLYGEMRVAAQAIVSGYQETDVRSYTQAASPTGKPYVVCRIGRILLYLEDRDAVETFVEAFDRARQHADAVFPSPYAEADARSDRRRMAHFERGGKPPPRKP